jgi:hypothetical protein
MEKTTKEIPLLNKIIGLSLEEAKQLLESNGYKTRIKMKDGKAMVGTCDYRTDRVNVTLVDDKVTNYSIG